MRLDTRPLAIDLFCGLGGWTEGLLAEGYYVVGFDIEQHVYGDARYPGHLVLQDVLTLHGRQFKVRLDTSQQAMGVLMEAAAPCSPTYSDHGPYPTPLPLSADTQRPRIVSGFLQNIWRLDTSRSMGELENA